MYRTTASCNYRDKYGSNALLCTLCTHMHNVQGTHAHTHTHTHTPLSLIPVTNPTISENLALFFSRLCLSFLVTMEINSDLVSQFPKDAVARYRTLTYQILCCSKTLLMTFLSEIPNQFFQEQELGTMATKAVVIQVLIRLLSCADVSRTLLECRGAVQMNTAKLLDMVCTLL